MVTSVDFTSLPCSRPDAVAVMFGGDCAHPSPVFVTGYGALPSNPVYATASSDSRTMASNSRHVLLRGDERGYDSVLFTEPAGVPALCCTVSVRGLHVKRAKGQTVCSLMVTRWLSPSLFLFLPSSFAGSVSRTKYVAAVLAVTAGLVAAASYTSGTATALWAPATVTRGQSVMQPAALGAMRGTFAGRACHHCPLFVHMFYFVPSCVSYFAYF